MDKQERNVWWGPPRNYADKVSERKISWLELFYDLVYAAVIAQLTEHLASNTSWHQLLFFLLLFTLTLWSWMNGAYYHDTHGNTGIRTRFLNLWQMMAVAAVAITIKDFFAGYHQGFAIAFSILSIIITYLWWSQGYYDPSHKALSRYYLLTYSIGIILFGISIFTPQSTAYILWTVALLFNINVGFIAAPSSTKELKRRGLVTSVSASMVERFGLFTIIVLGETIIGIVYGVSIIPNKSFSIWIGFMLGILIAFLLWWVYFDMLGESKPKVGFIYMQGINFMHLALLASFAILGSNMRVILSDVSPHTGTTVRWMFGGAVAIILFTIAGLTSIMEEEEEEVMRIVMRRLCLMLIGDGLLIIVTTLLSAYFNTIIFLSIIALIMFVPVMLGTKLYVHYKLFSREKGIE